MHIFSELETPTSQSVGPGQNQIHFLESDPLLGSVITVLRVILQSSKLHLFENRRNDVLTK